MQQPNEQGQKDKTLHRTRKTEQHEFYLKHGLNQDDT